jgi:hypothetical protein
MCVYMGLGSNDCFMADAALIGGHYKTNIISDVGHPRSDLVVLLVLYMVVYPGHQCCIIGPSGQHQPC